MRFPSTATGHQKRRAAPRRLTVCGMVQEVTAGGPATHAVAAAARSTGGKAIAAATTSTAAGSPNVVPLLPRTLSPCRRNRLIDLLLEPAMMYHASLTGMVLAAPDTASVASG